MKKHIIKMMALCLSLIICVWLAGCKDKGNENESVEAPAVSNKTESTVSELVPPKSTFPDKYLFIKSGETEYNIKGNSAFDVTEGKALQYDPNIFEGVTHEGKFTVTGDLGIGSSCVDFMSLYGITRGYYSAIGNDGKAVDPTVKGDNPFTLRAVLSYNEDNPKITLVSGGKVNENVEGLIQNCGGTLESMNIGKDLLMVTLKVKGDLTVEGFTVEHFVF